MRYLHPVSHQEKFIASGTYVTTAGDTPSLEQTEEWSIHLQPGDARFIRIDRAATPTSEHLLAEILQSSEGNIERVDLVWFRQIVSRRVSLTMFDAYVQVGYKIEPGEREYLEVDVPNGTHLLPPFLLFTLGAVNLPDIDITADGHWLLVDALTPVNPPPLKVETISWTIGDETQTLNVGRRQIETQVYESQSQGSSVKAWRDQRLHLPVRIEEQQAGQTVRTSMLRSMAY